MNSTTPLFLLKTSNTCLEVARFSVNDWGLSSHYTMNLSLNKENHNLHINDRVTLQVDDQCFHAVISNIDQAPSAQDEQLKLTLVSPLEAKLNFSQSRVFSQQSLGQMIKNFLTEAGLVAGLDFELRLDSNTKKNWIHQDNESGLTFFNRIMTTYGLVFTTLQQENHAICIISDSLEKLPKDSSLTLSIEPASGFNQQNAVSDLSVKAKLLPQSIAIHDYDEKKAGCVASQTSSCLSFANGRRALNGHVSSDALEGLQAAYDQHAQMITLLTQTAAKPGQRLQLNNSQFSKTKFRVEAVTIVGVQKPASGSLPLALQESLHHSRLHYHLSISSCGSGQMTPKFPKPATSFKTAKIEHRPGQYADLSETGKYHVRLQADEHPEQKAFYSCSPKTKASPRLRNALYFAGNDYGFSHPFQQGSEVILAYENGHNQRPMIIAALANKKAQSVVRAKNDKDHLIASRYGSYLLFQDEADEKIIELATAKKNNSLTLTQQKDKASFTLASSKGEFHLNALENLNLLTQAQFSQISKIDQHLWIQKDAELHSEKGHLSLDSDQTTSINSDKQINIKAKQQSWIANDVVRLKADKVMQLKTGKTITLICEQGKQSWQNSKGSIYLKASQSLTLKACGSKMKLSSEQLSFSTQGFFQLNADEVHGLG